VATPSPGVRGHYEEGLDAISDDGVVPVPDGPGLGIEYDCDFIFDNCTGSVHTYE
jgi:L-alanine-DL-glutamate epimerase-like enolase superfamily enzyme